MSYAIETNVDYMQFAPSIGYCYLFMNNMHVPVIPYITAVNTIAQV